jgi:RNA polymerase sigma factor (sigma-70 family)
MNATSALRLASEPAIAGEFPDAESAFERAYGREFPRVYAYVRYRVGNADTADDLTSQAFLRALDRLATFDPLKGEIGPWLLGIARNVVRDHLRARRRWRWLPLDWLGERADPGPDPERGLIRSELEQRLLDALAALSARERDILGLKFGAGLTNRAISRVTGLGESHVAVVVYRAVGRLRDRLEAREVPLG